MTRPIHNYPVVPEDSPRHRGTACPPVTRGDLGADFRNAMQFCLCDWRSSAIYRQAFVDARLGSVMSALSWYANFQDRASREDRSKPGVALEGWEKAAQRHADMGLFVWTINSMADTQVPRDMYETLCRVFGRRFLGFNEGEWDGAYYSRVAGGQIALSPERSRQDACRHYLDWLGATYARHQHRMTTISSLGTGCHYAAELGTRMVGLELSQGACRAARSCSASAAAPGGSTTCSWARYPRCSRRAATRQDSSAIRCRTSRSRCSPTGTWPGPSTARRWGCSNAATAGAGDRWKAGFR
jgi:hypothetical protein